jgi:hypothetical protein
MYLLNRKLKIKLNGIKVFVLSNTFKKIWEYCLVFSIYRRVLKILSWKPHLLKHMRQKTQKIILLRFMPLAYPFEFGLPFWYHLLEHGKSMCLIRWYVQKFRTDSITNYTLTFDITCWEATQTVMEAKPTRLTHKIATQLHLVAESCTSCSSRSRRPVRKLLDTPSYNISDLTSTHCTRNIFYTQNV